MIALKKTTLIIPTGYKSKLDFMHTEIAMTELKSFFELTFAGALNLIKVSSPTALHTEMDHQHSLISWKRFTLKKYGFTLGEGLYTTIQSRTKNEHLDNLHSSFIEKWEWEKMITEEQQTMEYLKCEGKKIFNSISATENFMYKFHPSLKPVLPKELKIFTTKELKQFYPHLTANEAEEEITKQYRATCIIDNNGSSLNGYIKVWSTLLKRSIKVSSLGFRTESKTKGHTKQTTIGGNIDQSRLSLFLLKKAHIGEVQISNWENETVKNCEAGNIYLL